MVLGDDPVGRGCDLVAALARWCSRLSQPCADKPPETRGYKAGSEEGQVVPKEACELSRGNQADRYEQQTGGNYPQPPSPGTTRPEDAHE